ncbi:MAG: DNA polymerase III subunit gamma/tau [bacterium]|nr:DNA polymerase III subunit gamma/tau [bacterium]
MPSLSQTYRPKSFADITGQSHVTETLRKEVETQVLGHAYLFSGPRGIGKTTTARVLAKALNCEKTNKGEPCNQCPSCEAMNAGRSLDVIELDAATHTGVDTVREAIIEHVRFAPTQGKRKVYILDEVHMFSSSSWNALLKTLEEPPAYAFFILATTEWHKVPATIISRCQRFEFKRIAPDVMTARLTWLAEQEHLTIDPSVLALIVSRADGFVRDAETLLGQLASLGEQKINADLASLVIPPTHLPLAAGLMGLWADRNHAASLKELDRLAEEGIPLLPLFDDLLLVVRRLLAASGDASLATTWKKGTADDQAIALLAARFTPGELSDMALLLLERLRDAKAGLDPLFELQLASTAVACGLLKNSTSISETPGPAAARPFRSDSPRGEENREKDSARHPSLDVKQEAASIKIEPPPEKQTPPPVVPSEPAAVDLSLVRAKWQTFIMAVEEKNHSLPFILKICRPEAVRGSVVVVRFQYSFHQDKILSDQKNRRIVEACLRETLGNPTLMIEGIIGEDVERAETRSHDVVNNIINAFGGTIVES